MSEQTVRLVERMRTRLRRATRRMTWAQLAFGAAVAAGSLAGMWLLAALLEATLWLGTGLRTGLALLGGATVLGVVAAFVARPLARLLGLVEGPSEEDVARAVGEHHPVVADRLVNLLQLADGQRSHAPAPYVDRAVQHLAEHIDEVEFEEVADFRPARKAARFAMLPLVAVLAFLLAAPSTFLGASERLLAPRTAFDRPAPFQFSVVPGHTRLVKGDSLRITVRTSGTVPETATLLLRQQDDESPRRIALRPDTVGTFRHTVPNVRQSLRYRVVASPVRTEWYAVEVAKRPFLRRLQLRVVPPAYTNRPARQFAPNVGSVTALPGSRVMISAALGGPPVTEASLEFENGPAEPLTVQGDSATGNFVLRREGSYVIRLRSDQGIPNRDPIHYETTLQTDARPSVSFLEPTGTTDLTPALTQPLGLQLSDDYGFRRVELFYRLAADPSAGDPSFASLELPLPEPRKTDQVITHNWLLAQESGLSLERGDEVVYYVKAWDNDTVNGPKSGRTVTQRLRLPSLSEQYEELEQLHEETGEQMRELDRQSESVQDQFRNLRDELRRTREADWEDRRQLERMRQEQESVEKGVEELSRQVERLNREMQRNDLSDSETARKFQELERVIEEIKSPELQKTLEKLRKAMENQNFPQMQQPLEDAKRRLEQHQRRLQRTLNLFKQLQARQKLEEMRRRTQELSEREQDIAEKTTDRMKHPEGRRDSSAQAENKPPSSDTSPSDSTATSSRSDSTAWARSDSTAKAQSDSTAARRSDSTRTNPPDSAATNRSNSRAENASASPDSTANEDLATEQEQAAQQMKELLEEMKEAEREMQDVPSAPKKKLQKLNEQLRQEDLPRQMQKNSQQLRKNQLQNARQRQQQIQKRLQNMQSQLSQMQQQMQGQQRQMNLTGLRSALENTLRLSQEQEQLRGTVEGLSDGPSVRRYAPEQKRLSDGLQHVADSLQSISGRLPEMSQAVQTMTGNALRAMETATTTLDERTADEAAAYQRTSMMHLNELALLLSSLLDQMNQQSGGGGSMSMQQLMQQLQQASGQQQKLNQQIQEFLNQAQGERLSKDLQERREQLAEQQRRIKEQLEEMNVGSEAQEQLLGDLEKIAEQMEQSADDLQNGRRRDLIDRQQQILTRLLNAQQSLRTQGKKEQRQGRTAEEEVDRQRPGERPDPEATDTLRRDLIRALEMGYNPDYEALIKRYFELLQEQEAPEE